MNLQLEPSLQTLSSEFARLERQVFWLRVAILLGLAAGAFLLLKAYPQPVLAAGKSDGILHVRGLIVEDANGVERVRLGAPLPDPLLLDGKRHPRQGVISGILLSDATGTERSGYFTSDADAETVFTLDSQHGQEVRFLTNKEGGTNFDLYDAAGNEAQLTVFPNGPKFVMTRHKQIVAQLPQPLEPSVQGAK